MIPFEKEPSLNETEEYIETVLNRNWDNVVRSTPGIAEDLKGRYPQLSETVSRNIRKDTEQDLDNLFGTGVPDFLVFDDNGEYLFVEVKSSEDNLRHTQLKWIRDFEGVNMEIWFAETPGEINDKLNSSNFDAYGFQDKKGSKSKNLVKKQKGKLMVELPKELASISNLNEGDSIEWRLKSKDELILDTR